MDVSASFKDGTETASPNGTDGFTVRSEVLAHAEILTSWSSGFGQDNRQDFLTVFFFGNGVRNVGGLNRSPRIDLKDENLADRWRAQIQGTIEDKSLRKHTRIFQALEKTLDHLDSAPQGDETVNHIILVSDGKLDGGQNIRTKNSPNIDEEERVLFRKHFGADSALLARLSARNIRFHALSAGGRQRAWSVGGNNRKRLLALIEQDGVNNEGAAVMQTLAVETGGAHYFVDPGNIRDTLWTIMVPEQYRKEPTGERIIAPPGATEVFISAPVRQVINGRILNPHQDFEIGLDGNKALRNDLFMPNDLQVQFSTTTEHAYWRIRTALSRPFDAFSGDADVSFPSLLEVLPVEAKPLPTVRSGDPVEIEYRIVHSGANRTAKRDEWRTFFKENTDALETSIKVIHPDGRPSEELQVLLHVIEDDDSDDVVAMTAIFENTAALNTYRIVPKTKLLAKGGAQQFNAPQNTFTVIGVAPEIWIQAIGADPSHPVQVIPRKDNSDIQEFTFPFDVDPRIEIQARAPQGRAVEPREFDIEIKALGFRNTLDGGAVPANNPDGPRIMETWTDVDVPLESIGSVVQVRRLGSTLGVEPSSSTTAVQFFQSLPPKQKIVLRYQDIDSGRDKTVEVSPNAEDEISLAGIKEVRGQSLQVEIWQETARLSPVPARSLSIPEREVVFDFKSHLLSKAVDTETGESGWKVVWRSGVIKFIKLDSEDKKRGFIQSIYDKTLALVEWMKQDENANLVATLGALLAIITTIASFVATVVLLRRYGPWLDKRAEDLGWPPLYENTVSFLYYVITETPHDLKSMVTRWSSQLGPMSLIVEQSAPTSRKFSNFTGLNRLCITLKNDKFDVKKRIFPWSAGSAVLEVRRLKGRKFGFRCRVAETNGVWLLPGHDGELKMLQTRSTEIQFEESYFSGGQVLEFEYQLGGSFVAKGEIKRYG